MTGFPLVRTMELGKALILNPERFGSGPTTPIKGIT